MSNKPFKLTPSGKDYIWGGNRLKNEFNKNLELDPLAESWECSTHPDGPSYVDSGQYKGLTLSEAIKENPSILGKYANSDGELPILIKFIDAKNDLSIQVHPSDSYADRNENGQRGKTEMWYVLDAQNDTHLIYGFIDDMNEDNIRKAILDGNILNLLNKIKIKKGDTFFIPAGIIHAICAGTLIVEIQENSNLTYRVYDYDRVDKDGNKRPLHINKALDVLNLEKAKDPQQRIKVINYKPGVAKELITRCEYFEVYKWLLNTEKERSIEYKTNNLTYRVLLCTDGRAELTYDEDSLKMKKGECVFIPANSTKINILGTAELLEVIG